MMTCYVTFGSYRHYHGQVSLAHDNLQLSNETYH